MKRVYIPMMENDDYPGMFSIDDDHIQIFTNKDDAEVAAKMLRADFEYRLDCEVNVKVITVPVVE